MTRSKPRLASRGFFVATSRNPNGRRRRHKCFRPHGPPARRAHHTCPTFTAIDRGKLAKASGAPSCGGSGCRFNCVAACERAPPCCRRTTTSTTISSRHCPARYCRWFNVTRAGTSRRGRTTRRGSALSAWGGRGSILCGGDGWMTRFRRNGGLNCHARCRRGRGSKAILIGLNGVIGRPPPPRPPPD